MIVALAGLVSNRVPASEDCSIDLRPGQVMLRTPKHPQRLPGTTKTWWLP